MKDLICIDEMVMSYDLSLNPIIDELKTKLNLAK